METSIIDAATGFWKEVLIDCGMNAAFLKKSHGECPICTGMAPKKGLKSFRFDDKEGRGTSYCTHHGALSGFGLVRMYLGLDNTATAARIAEAIRRIRGESALAISSARTVVPSVATLTPEDYEKNAVKIRKAWHESKPIDRTTLAVRYLKGRGLALTTLPNDLRMHPKMGYFDPDGKKYGEFPVMLGIVRAVDGTALAMHRTYLLSNGKKIAIPDPENEGEFLPAKKLMKPAKSIRGGAIQLYPAGEVLGFAEGIESAVGAYELTGIPCWAAISATIMKNAEVPDFVKKVVIFTDFDLPDAMGKRAGQDAAQHLAMRLREKGIEVEIRMPSKEGTDFLDEYLAVRESRYAA